MTYSFRVNSHSEVDYLRIIDENKDAWAFVVLGAEPFGYPRLYIHPKVAKKATETNNQLVAAGYLPVPQWVSAPHKETKFGWVFRYVQEPDIAVALAEIEKLMTPPKHKVTITVLPAKRAEP